jgi:DNA-binding transcriptional LysR family regulator
VTGIADQLVLRELPFEVPAIHVDALWHRRVHHHSAHQWLRDVVAQLPSRAHADKLTSSVIDLRQ